MRIARLRWLLYAAVLFFIGNVVAGVLFSVPRAICAGWFGCEP